MTENFEKSVLICIVLSIISVAMPATFAGPEIPKDAAQIPSWFTQTIKPASAMKGTIDPNLETAEAAPVIIKVRKDGSGQFKTVQDALDSVKTENTVRTIIDIGAGVYNEKIKVERFKPYITFLGNPNSKPTLSFNGNAAKYGTDDSATVIVDADYFIASNIIFENSSPRPTATTKGGQALALRLQGDKAMVYNCRLIGFQDTLCDDKGMHFYKDCYIEGTVDFIFGGGAGLFLNCEIHVIPGDPMAMITAQARSNEKDVGGFVFAHCNITGEGNHATLGRSWMPSPKVMFLYCTLGDGSIDPLGWSDNRKPETQKTVFFAEFGNKGPLSDLSKRVPWMKKFTDADAKTYLTLEYIQGTKWLLPPPSAAGATLGSSAAPGAAPGVAPTAATANEEEPPIEGI